ncbi:hypothetical protein HNP86_001601 [Methanococcus maripaludis]|uniref:Uncharacterized protein n=1 Tax=Methanococcus maripaludis TaxID=39152 RepID=A0A7J9NUU7_METMI|nr:hypothetical protein [Methanococcus maripaludis]MBA2851448.1 hypothetical protein [Methanococcus maripaludis]
MIKKLLPIFLIFLLVSPSYATWTDYIPGYSTYTSVVDAVTGAVEGVSSLSESVSDLVTATTDLVTTAKESLFGDNDVVIAESDDLENKTMLGTSTDSLVEVNDINQVALASLDELKQMILSESAVELDMRRSGEGLNLLKTSVYSRNKLYGFSAMPISSEIYVLPSPSSEGKNKFHFEKYEVWAESIQEPGVKLWYYTVTPGTTFAPGTTVTGLAQTHVKGKDEYYSTIHGAITSNANLDKLDEIIESTPEQFEVKCRVSGYCENWYEVTTVDEWGVSHTSWVRGSNIPINILQETTNMYSYTKPGKYFLNGSVGSYPLSDSVKLSDKWCAYASDSQGSTSNIVSQFWSVPIHVVGGSTQYKLYLGNNRLYHNSGITNTDVRIVAVAIDSDGNFEVMGDSKYENVNFGESYTLGGSIGYNPGSQNISSYKIYAIIYGEILRNDGSKLPIWTVSRPYVNVLDNTEIITSEDVADLEDLYSLGTAEELDNQKTLALATIDERIEELSQLKEYAKSNNDIQMASAVDNAISCLKKAKSVIESLSVEDTEEEKAQKIDLYKLYLSASSMYEKSAKAYQYGNTEDGEYYSDMADELVSNDAVVIASEDVLDYLNSLPLIGSIPGGATTLIIVALCGGVLIAISEYQKNKKGSSKRRKGY